MKISRKQNFISDRELLVIFPQAIDIIPKKIKELEQKRVEFLDAIKKKLMLVKHNAVSTFSIWFWREWIKVNEGQELLKIEKDTARFKRLLFISKGKKLKGEITEDKIQQALTVPIENLINRPLRKAGKNLVGLCPFHNEKSPSFYIYIESNSFYCYGCQKGGNVINFVRLFYGYSFREAMKFLVGEE